VQGTHHRVANDHRISDHNHDDHCTHDDHGAHHDDPRATHSGTTDACACAADASSYPRADAQEVQLRRGDRSPASYSVRCCKYGISNPTPV
jgi:hypothetical protein